MGQDKALLLVQGKPLLRRVCEVAQQCAQLVWVVTPWPDRYQALLPEGCGVIPETPLPGEPAPHGPLLAFTQGFAAVQTEWTLLLACDLPRLQASVLRHWATHLNPAQALVFAPRDAHGWQPLCGFYHRDSRSALTDFVACGGRSFQAWLSEIAAAPLPPLSTIPGADAAMLLNCNTPADLKAAQIAEPADPADSGC